MSSNGPESPTTASGNNIFQRRLAIATYGLLLIVLVIHLLQLFAILLQPLLVAILIAYAILLPHRWLVKRGIRPALAYIVLVSLLLAAFIIMAYAVQESIDSMLQGRLDQYREKVEALEERWVRLLGGMGFETAKVRIRDMARSIPLSRDDLFRAVRGVAGAFGGFFTFSLVVFVYLVFLLAERLTFPRRMALAFGDARAEHILRLVQSINEAIVNYIAVKAWISLVTGALSYVVFAMFGIDFSFFWGVLIFFLNFIPYLGGLVAMAPPAVLAFLNSPLEGIVVIVLLIGIQLFTGQFLEPRMAGSRLNISPLLILLSLGFWGYLWGVGGMLVAVPLTVVIKIVLDHIPETRPIGTLMSNV